MVSLSSGTVAKNNGPFLYLAWMAALISMAGSLFFSNILKLPPCDLCWYQRAFMFPLVFVLATGFLSKDSHSHLYSLPLTLTGWLIAAYHNLLYYKWITPTLTPCTSGVSCTERQLDLFGFLSIPLMSLISFSIILIFIGLHLKNSRKRNFQ